MIGLRANPACRARPAVTGRSARQRERDAEEAGWERRLRQLARREPAEPRPAIAPAPPPLRTALDLVRHVARHDNLLLPRALPLAAGSDAEDLVCGRCATVIASRTSRHALRSRHPEGDRLIVRCTCRALNLLCRLAAPRPGQVHKRRAPAEAPARANNG